MRIKNYHFEDHFKRKYFIRIFLHLLYATFLADFFMTFLTMKGLLILNAYVNSVFIYFSILSRLIYLEKEVLIYQ